MNAVLTCDSYNEKATGKRSAGNPHAAFDEGSLGNTLAPTLLPFVDKDFRFSLSIGGKNTCDRIPDFNAIALPSSRIHLQHAGKQ